MTDTETWMKQQGVKKRSWREEPGKRDGKQKYRTPGDGKWC